jgi:hypothetical protein
VARQKTREEKLFSAAVLKRSFALRGEERKEGFQFVYRGVLRDLGLEEGEVDEYLSKHLAKVDAAIGRGPP